MALLAHPRKQPEYRQQRSHESFLTPLRAYAEAHAEAEARGASSGASGVAGRGGSGPVSLKDRFWDEMVNAAALQYEVVEVDLKDVVAEVEEGLAAGGLGGLRKWEQGPKAKRARTRVLEEAELLEELAIQEETDMVR